MGGVLAHGQPACEPGPGSTQQDGGVPARDSRRMIFPRSTGLIGLSIPLRIKGVVLFVHNGFTLCVFLERSLHFVCAGFYLGPSSPWCKSRGRRYAPWADGATLGRSRNAAPSSPRFFLRRPEAARNPLGDGHFCSDGGADLAAHRDRAFSSQRPPRPSALSFVGGDRPGSPSSSLRAERPQKPAALFPSYHGTSTTGCQSFLAALSV